jgi:hypothetical protein
MNATQTAVRDADVRIDWTPTMIAGVLIRRIGIHTVPVTLRDNAHRAVPAGTVNTWFTIGQFRPAGARDRVWVVAKRLKDGTVAYGVEA